MKLELSKKRKRDPGRNSANKTDRRDQLDLQDPHIAAPPGNDQLGYEEINRRIRAIFSIPFRRSDLIARWFSGDEIVILFDADEEFALRKIGQLEEAARQQGMAFHFQLGIWDVGKDPVEKVIDELAEKVLAQKAWEKQQPLKSR